MGDEQRPHERADVDAGATGALRLSDDRFYRVLASRQRRRLLYYLLDGEERTVEELATLLTGWKAADSGRMQTPDDREEVRIELFHSHLPLLDEAGLISYDTDPTVVSIEPLDETVEDLIAKSIEVEPPDV